MQFLILLMAVSLVSGGYSDLKNLPLPGSTFGFHSNDGTTGQGSGINYPKYEDHIVTRPLPTHLSFETSTSTTTRVHTIRLTSTSDVWVTSAVMVPVTLTQYTTRRDFVAEQPDTVTSYIRVTNSPVFVVTSTVQKEPVRTLVSRFSQFQTVTSTIDFWQPITHYNTSFEVLTLPVIDTQTLAQVIHSTVTVRSSTLVTRTRHSGYHGFNY